MSRWRRSFLKYFPFQVRQKHLQFICLPFGLTTSPRVFFKVLLAIATLIRLKGVRLYHYLDDLLVLSQDKYQLLVYREQGISTLFNFGWLLNIERATYIQANTGYTWGGAQFDTAENTISLPFKKKKKKNISVIRETISQAFYSLTTSESITMPKNYWRNGLCNPHGQMGLVAVTPFSIGFLQQWKSGTGVNLSTYWQR